MVGCEEMPVETRSPHILKPIVLALCAGTAACIAAFMLRKFLLLFVAAGAIWVIFLLYLYFAGGQEVRSSIAKKIVSWNRRSRGLAHFRGCMVRHRLARPITQIALRVAVKHPTMLADHHQRRTRPRRMRGLRLRCGWRRRVAEDGGYVEFGGVVGDIEACGDFFIG